MVPNIEVKSLQLPYGYLYMYMYCYDHSYNIRSMEQNTVDSLVEVFGSLDQSPKQCVWSFSNCVRFGETTTNFDLASYTLKMASFEENLDRAIRQARLVLSGNDC